MLGSIISAIGNVVGGVIGGNATEDANKRNIAASRELNQNKIQWTAEDAKKAGIHPLAALGSAASGSWAQPTIAANTSLGDSIGAAAGKVGEGVAAQAANNVNGLQAKLLEAQIRNTDANTANTLAEATSRTNIAKLRASEALKMGDMKVTKNPNWSDTQDYTNRYGEMADWFMGPSVAAADLAHNQGDNYMRMMRSFLPFIPGPTGVARPRFKRSKK